MFYANYLKFFERARTEWLRAQGFEQDALREEHHLVFVVAHVEVDYLAPAFFNESLQVSAKIARLGRASLNFAQAVQRENGETVCRGEVRVVSVDSGSFKPVPIPDFIRQRINLEY